MTPHDAITVGLGFVGAITLVWSRSPDGKRVGLTLIIAAIAWALYGLTTGGAG